MPVMIETDRLTLREFRPEDFDAVHAYASDPLVTRFTSFGPNSPEETREFLARTLEAAAAVPRRGYTFGVIERATARLIGSCGLEACDQTERHYSFGYCFNRDVWRQGFGKETARAIVKFGFEQLDSHRLMALVFTGNTASARILEGLGFRQEGLLRQGMYAREWWHDILTFAQLRSEWRDQRR
jgi:RimJ/RimL family protein N-acetyltransferase